MEMTQASNRIHPLMAGAAVSVMLASLVGVAAMTGLLPNSHGITADSSHAATQPITAVVASSGYAATPAAMQQTATPTTPSPQYALIPVQTQQQQDSPAVVREVVEHKTVVHHQYVQHTAAPKPPHHAQYAQYDAAPRYAPTPVYQRPVSNSPVGIGVGAVVGGLLGSQVGGGNGKTLATIAGAVGGGYLGNEVAKRNF